MESNIQTQNACALQLQKNGDFEAASAIFKALVFKNPQNAALWGNWALVLEDLQNFESAENAFLQSIFLGKNTSENTILRTNYAAFLMRHFCGTRHSDALPHLEIARKNNPHTPIVLNALGVFYADKNEWQKAQHFFESALKINPNHAPSRMNLAQLLLKMGDYPAGLHIGRNGYSNAFRQTQPYDVFPKGRYAPLEKDKKSFQNKKLLIIPEQGLGDEIQFARFVPFLKENLGFQKIHWMCRESLVDLLTSLPNVDFFEGLKNLQFGAQTFWAPHDFWCFLMDLPELINFSPEKFSLDFPYFKNAPKSTVNHPKILKIGFVLKGNPKHSNDLARSIHDEQILKPLFDFKNLELFSFQKNDSLRTFWDTAALLKTMDFLVSVDSAVAHLAGALNVPTFLLLPQFRSDWRWGLNSKKTFWYPSHCLIRQAKSQQWELEISTIADFFKEKLAKN